MQSKVCVECKGRAAPTEADMAPHTFPTHGALRLLLRVSLLLFSAVGHGSRTPVSPCRGSWGKMDAELVEK